jgi:hypothetical protein
MNFHNTLYIFGMRIPNTYIDFLKWKQNARSKNVSFKKIKLTFSSLFEKVKRKENIIFSIFGALYVNF